MPSQTSMVEQAREIAAVKFLRSAMKPSLNPAYDIQAAQDTLAGECDEGLAVREALAALQSQSALMDELREALDRWGRRGEIYGFATTTREAVGLGNHAGKQLAKDIEALLAKIGERP